MKNNLLLRELYRMIEKGLTERALDEQMIDEIFEQRLPLYILMLITDDQQHIMNLIG